MQSQKGSSAKKEGDEALAVSPAPRLMAWTDGAWVRWGANRSPDADRWFAMTRYSRFVT